MVTKPAIGNLPAASILTQRELELCTLLAFGHTNREAAEIMSISERTVETHRANLMAKLSIKTRAGLVAFAMENNLLRASAGGNR